MQALYLPHMTPTATELFKVLFTVAMFACVCGVIRLAFLAQLAPRLRLTLGGFLTLMLLPTSYLYARLAFPAAADALQPFQSMAIWTYGPLLLAIQHLTVHQRMRAWQVGVYTLPLGCAAAWRLTTYSRGLALPPWWELVSLTQAALFAVTALLAAVRRRGQLRILVTGFAGSSFGALVYLCAGLLALLLLDFFVHWRFYIGRPPTLSAFYLWVTPVALYSLGISLALIWRASAGVAQASVPEPTALASASDDAIAETPRKLELSAMAAHELAQQLETLMREKRLHTRNDLSLADLARELRLSTHLTSELLNGHLNSSFYEFVNRHRAAEAAALLRSSHGKFSIADVAYEAGFNNPNTFFREFKRVHGVTPAQFRRSAENEPGPRERPGLLRPN
jgi:AraC-like DNA-binding protein